MDGIILPGIRDGRGCRVAWINRKPIINRHACTAAPHLSIATMPSTMTRSALEIRFDTNKTRVNGDTSCHHYTTLAPPHSLKVQG